MNLIPEKSGLVAFEGRDLFTSAAGAVMKECVG